MNLNFGAKSDKFRSKEVEVDGIVFDSKKEAECYREVKHCKEAGEIERFEMQKRYELIPAQYGMVAVKGKLQKRCVERAITYLADFVLYFPDGEVVVLDPKGNKTDVYRIKKKLMLMVHGVKIKEV